MVVGGVDAFQIETCQDLLQAKAAINGARRARELAGRDLPIFVNVTVETTGTMLLGSEIGAALTALAALEIDAIGLNCGTGNRDERAPAPPGRHAAITLGCMPNAGLPELTPEGARYPMGPQEFGDYLAGYTNEFGLGLVGGCCGTTPEHIAVLAAAVAGQGPKERTPEVISAVSSLYAEVPLRQDTSYLALESGPSASGSLASGRRCWPRTGRTASRSPSSKAAVGRIC